VDVLAFLAQPGTNQVALGALVTLMVVSLLRGWVVPRAVLIDRIADKDAQIANLVKEKDEWKAAYTKSEEGRAELTKQNSTLVEGGETAAKLMETLRTKLET